MSRCSMFDVSKELIVYADKPQRESAAVMDSPAVSVSRDELSRLHGIAKAISYL